VVTDSRDADEVDRHGDERDVTPERWREVEGVFRAALERAPGERAGFLERACGADAELRREVESLLAANQGATGFLEPSVVATPPRVEADLTGRLATALAGRYTIERELGRGGMATVYRAEDLKHSRPVALKVMHPELGLGAGPERFLREIRTTARLDHPHVLPVHDSGEGAGLLWYTMPYVQGESLRQRLERTGPLPVDEAVRLAREAADALACAHEAGVVHRDVKPENILLSGGHARVADFGIAQALEAAGDGRLTATGVSVGTPAYMSPEQALGARALDGRSDVYSLGCVLYELLTGEPPFTGTTPQAVIGRRFVESPPPVREARPAVPPGVEAALARALAREPADRFQTAAEFRDVLAEPPARAAEVPASVPGASAPARIPLAGLRKGRRHLPAGIALLALAILLGLGVLFAWRRTAGERREGAGGPQVLAVLPFEAHGDSAEVYLADGVSDAVRGKLAALPGLQVIAGASSGEYRHTSKSPREIARELGVQYLVIGTVGHAGSGKEARLRVSPELVEVHSRGAPTTRWQEPLEAPVTDVFQLQTDLARGVAEALGIPLGANERMELAKPPTQNLAAYNAYLRGEALWNQTSTSPATARQALTYYEQAVALDSGFVEAWYRLAGSHLYLYGAGGAVSLAQAESARAAAERVLALAPDRPEGPIALGHYFLRVPNDNRRALEQFSLALRMAPNSVDALLSAGAAEQSLGRWEAALEHFRRGRVLDPRSRSAGFSAAITLLFLRRYPEAIAAADRGLALAPTTDLFEVKAMIYLAQGDLAKARAVVRGAMNQVEPAALVTLFGWNWDLCWVLEEPEQQLLLRLPPSAYDNNRASWGLILAQTYALRGDEAGTRVYADSARLAFEEQLQGAPKNAQLHALYGVALAFLGRTAEAMREGERAVELAPLDEQAANGAYVRHQLVRIYLLTGEPAKALDQLEPLLKIPYYLSPGWLKVDPTFDQLRSNPRFRRVLDGTV
jgi:serine/threonine-protein kinase